MSGEKTEEIKENAEEVANTFTGAGKDVVESGALIGKLLAKFINFIKLIAADIYCIADGQSECQYTYAMTFLFIVIMAGSFAVWWNYEDYRYPRRPPPGWY